MFVRRPSRWQIQPFERQSAIAVAERDNIAATSTNMQLHVHMGEAVIADHAWRPNGANLLPTNHLVAMPKGPIQDDVAQHGAVFAVTGDDLDAAGLLAWRKRPRHRAIKWRQNGRAAGGAVREHQVQPINAGALMRAAVVALHDLDRFALVERQRH